MFRVRMARHAGKALSLTLHLGATTAGVLAAQARPASAPAPIAELRLDPLMLGSVREYRNIIRTIGPDIFPGWRANDTPILLYRPGVQDILIGAPHRPPGYAPYAGPVSLAGETIYARNDSTLMDLDDQNTSTDLDGIRVLVVADQHSRLRNNLRALYGRPQQFLDDWLDGWNFVASPYDELQLLLHEAFHVHQDRQAPDKSANEAAVARYPVLDPENNALFALEGRILRDALLAAEPAVLRDRARLFLAVRRARRAGLDTSAVAYEDLNEYSEGLGRYVEYRFLQLGDRVKPTTGMWLHAGFRGYRGVLRPRFEAAMEDLAKVAANSDDRFGNRFGTGPLRFRLYYLGAAQGLLLDAVNPGWKQRIFGPGVYLTDLLADGLSVPAEDQDPLLARAKTEYGYERVREAARRFADEGAARIRQRVDSILNTRATLVTIEYGTAGERIGIGFTPFGVTAISPQAAIYDMVPISIRFGNGVLLELKSVIPVLVDRGAHTVQFVVARTAQSLVSGGTAVESAEFSLAASPGTSVTAEGNQLRIRLQ